MTEGPRFARTAMELGQALGLQRTAAFKFWALVPREPDGTVDVEKARAFREDEAAAADARRRVQGKRDILDAAAAGVNASALTDARLLNTRLDAAAKAIALKKARGKLVPRELLAQILTDRMRTFRRRLRAAARAIAQDLVGVVDQRQQIAVISRVHDDLLEEAYGRVQDAVDALPPEEEDDGGDDLEPVA